MVVRKTEIVVCIRCMGVGSIDVATGDERRYETKRCPACNGIRVLNKVVTEEYNALNDASESKKK